MLFHFSAAVPFNHSLVFSGPRVTPFARHCTPPSNARARRLLRAPMGMKRGWPAACDISYCRKSAQRPQPARAARVPPAHLRNAATRTRAPPPSLGPPPPPAPPASAAPARGCTWQPALLRRSSRTGVPSQAGPRPWHARRPETLRLNSGLLPPPLLSSPSTSLASARTPRRAGRRWRCLSWRAWWVPPCRRAAGSRSPAPRELWAS